MLDTMVIRIFEIDQANQIGDDGIDQVFFPKPKKNRSPKCQIGPLNAMTGIAPLPRS